jgi:hypothetical protein
MKSTLAALLVGVAVLSSAGSAQAADAVRADIQSKVATEGALQPSVPMALTASQTETTTTGQSQAHGPVALTDNQMKSITAGHFYNQGYFHYGWFSPDYGWSWYWGPHY